MPTPVSASATQERELWTAEESLNWLKPGVRADLIYGERTVHSQVSLRHADLLNFVDHLLRRYLEPCQLGRLYREVVAVRLGSRNVFLPDLAFVPAARLRELQRAHIPFAPSLVVEALSEFTSDRDTGPKFAAYEEHGVKEYWMLDPETLAHRFYRSVEGILTEYGRDVERIQSCTVPGFFVRREWLDPAHLPSVADCLLDIEQGDGK